MRSLPPTLDAKWRAGITTLARAWRLIRQDGLVLAATEHDRDLQVADTLFKAAFSLSESPVEAELSLSPGHAALSGALSLAGMDADDIKLGLWDQARVEAFLIDWQEPTISLPLWSGFVQTIVCHGSNFELNIQTLEPAMNQMVGRLYARSCDASLGDGRCGVNLNDPAYRATATIMAVQSDRALTTSFVQEFDLNAFSGGILRVNSGRAKGLSRPIQQVELVGGQLAVKLAQPMPILPAQGDAVTFSLGCDKRYDTCRTRFGNGLNFRGVPTLPGEAATVTGPSPAGNVGGKR
ncbi:DUF2163 domain-containing protein [Aquidulcibacter sp.]|uniref:DUF2163 domain-containing protein n=1 Tax=Aquidulcibacter sp. TaxID=2052990 RepID=UPI003BA57D4C